jgi:hypothetical protein
MLIYESVSYFFKGRKPFSTCTIKRSYHGHVFLLNKTYVCWQRILHSYCFIVRFTTISMHQAIQRRWNYCLWVVNWKRFRRKWSLPDRGNTPVLSCMDWRKPRKIWIQHNRFPAQNSQRVLPKYEYRTFSIDETARTLFWFHRAFLNINYVLHQPNALILFKEH